MKIFRRLCVALLICLVGAVASAAEAWMDDLAAAQARAAKEHKGLLLEFTGSTWCPPCKALHAAVLTQPEFAAFSHDLVLVALDFPTLAERAPEKVRANPKLAALMALKEKYGAPGFPTVILFDAKGKEVTRIVGYDGSKPSVYLAKLQR